jgi:hypothetical protein
MLPGSRSDPEVPSTIEPMLTEWLKPKFRFGERSRMAVQMAPLWEMKASFPRWGIRAANVPFKPIPGQITPRQLGPMTRSPPALASFLILSSIALPCSPASLPPAEMTTAPPTPAAAHSRTISGTVSIGVDDGEIDGDAAPRSTRR